MRPAADLGCCSRLCGPCIRLERAGQMFLIAELSLDTFQKSLSTLTAEHCIMLAATAQ